MMIVEWSFSMYFRFLSRKWNSWLKSLLSSVCPSAETRKRSGIDFSYRYHIDTIYRTGISISLEDPRRSLIGAFLPKHWYISFSTSAERNLPLFLPVITRGYARDAVICTFIPHIGALGPASVRIAANRIFGRYSIGDKVLPTPCRNCFVHLCVESDKNVWLYRARAPSR